MIIIFKGFLLGWEGCMAEDSISFKNAFSATKIGTEIRNGKVFHKFANNLSRVPSKIFQGKLGDTSVRLGRYKLIRYNAPKDLRTGPSRQHIVTHEGPLWDQAAEKDKCRYNEQGVLLTPNCRVEPFCRPHSTWGMKFCMRDHYYQLFDLEKNFGEKRFCGLGRNQVTSKQGPYEALSAAWAPQGVDRNRREAEKSLFGSKANKKEKPSDPFGFSSGIETGPGPEWINECCILNIDERPKKSRPNRPREIEQKDENKVESSALQRSLNALQPCATIRYTEDNGKTEKTGGNCVFRSEFNA